VGADGERFMDFSKVDAFLNRFVNYEVLPGFGFAQSGYDLSHIGELLRRLDNPHLGPLTIHVAGSKGKGSVAAAMAGALSACHVMTGLYTSPHLLHLGERIRVDGECAAPAELEWGVEVLRPHLDAMRQEGRWRSFTYFELLTVLAFLHFRWKRVDAQVLEVGLGGRLDATNVVEPDVCIITPISLEHTAVLGDTVGKIAFEKAGIIKSGAEVICAPQTSDALRVVEAACLERGANLMRVGVDSGYEIVERTLEGQAIRYDSPLGERIVHTPLAGTYQAENTATVLAAVDALGRRGARLDDECVAQGIAAVSWPGRFQVLERTPLTLLDGAHNPASVRRLAESVALLTGRRGVVFVLGFSSDKDVRGSVVELSSLGPGIVLTSSLQPRSLRPRDIAMRIADLGLVVDCEEDPDRAMRRARMMAGEEGTVCVAGSLYLVGEVLSRWGASRRSISTRGDDPSRRDP
jgi:dihydrofolate synthase / folylpolyglutamate synthase